MAKVVSKKTIKPEPHKVFRFLGLKEFSDRRNKILITRNIGGLGDIFMHRMMFEDFHLLMPNCEIHFACPSVYHDAVIDHPYVAKVLESSTVNRSDYIVSYNTTKACGYYELRKAPLSDLNRSDIWAKHCGLSLTKHNMHIKLTEAEKLQGKAYINSNEPTVIVCPTSSMVNKNLSDKQLAGVVKGLLSKGYNVIGLHDHRIPYFDNNNLPYITGVSIRTWMAILDQADYVISVDTAAFHCRGGMQKPVLGIFTFADGLVYGKHYQQFELVQKHRSLNPAWTCGPCYNWTGCPKEKINMLKPCLTEITSEMILDGFDRLTHKYPYKD